MYKQRSEINNVVTFQTHFLMESYDVLHIQPEVPRKESRMEMKGRDGFLISFLYRVFYVEASDLN